MRRGAHALVLVVAAAAGCASTGGQADAGGKAGSPGARPGASAEDDEVGLAMRADEPIVPSTDPERTRRAREIYLRGVRLLAGQPRIDEAIRDFQQALEIDPLFYRAHFKLGICYYHKGQYPLEISEYRKCLTIQPSYVPAWLNLGHAYLARDELEQARDAYERVLELDPNHAVALYNKALVEFDLHNEPESLRLFKTFIKVDGAGEMGDRAREYAHELEQRQTVTTPNGETP